MRISLTQKEDEKSKSGQTKYAARSYLILLITNCGTDKKWKNATYFPENVTKETSSGSLLIYTTVFSHLQIPSLFSDIIFYIVSFYSLYLAQLDREMILKIVKTVKIHVKW